MDIKTIIAKIGIFAPIILFLLSLLFLRNKNIYLIFFIVGTILNNILNIILKYAIKEPRPLENRKNIEIAIANNFDVNFHYFGMPSGHAQNCAFSLFFIFFTLKNYYITTLYLILSVISMSERYIYNKHTILQIIVGFIIGGCFAGLIYFISHKYIKGSIKMKLDDYAFYK